MLTLRFNDGHGVPDIMKARRTKKADGGAGIRGWCLDVAYVVMMLALRRFSDEEVELRQGKAACRSGLVVCRTST